MKVTWLGHACFMLESEGYQVVLDPFTRVPGLKDVHTKADLVLCSHEHYDHHYLEGVTMRTGGKNPFTVETVDTFHDAKEGALRGKNTVHLLRTEGLTAVHLGDLGHRLTETQAAPLRHCDVLLIPVGGTYTMDGALAAETVQQLQPRVVVPMHYRSATFGFDNIDGVEPFIKALPTWSVRRYEESSLDLTADTETQIALLKPQLHV